MLHTFYIIFKHVFKFFLKTLFILSPKPKNIWTFKGFGDLYCDNSMYLFNYINENKSKYKNIRPVWVTSNADTFCKVKKLGFEVLMSTTLKGKFYLFRSKYHFYGDYCNYFISKKTVSVNLWHGIGLKKMDFDIKTGPLKSLFDGSVISRIKRLDIYRRPNFVISSSKFISKTTLISAFRVKEVQCLSLGYPRNDLLFKEISDNQFLRFREINISQSIVTNSKVFIYMPTWRDSGNNFVLDSGIDFVKLNRQLVQNNDFFVLKLHPNTKLNINLQEYSNIFNYPRNIDLYDFLNYTDVLITDYSSVFFDFLLTGKKIIYFPFDFHKYSQERGFNFDYNEITTGNISFNFEDLLLEMNSLEIDSEKYDKLTNKIWEFRDGNSAKRITNYFYQK